MLRVNVLSLTAVAIMMIFCSSGQAQDAVLWFSFEGTGDVATDSSGNGNNGTIVGATRVEGANGQGQGIALGLADNYVDVAIKLEQKGTIEFWFKPNWDGNAPESYRLFDAGLGGIFWHIGKALGKDVVAPIENWHVDDFGFFFEDAIDTDEVVFVPAAGNIIADKWHHIAVTWDFESKLSVLYIDGAEVANLTTGFQGFPAVKPTIRIGFNGGAGDRPAHNGADGVIDEFAIYHRTLSAGEIQMDMQKGAAVEPLHKLATTWGEIRM
ncbi:LamG domain-containing protein [Candidatus Poribacteria bacterium]